MRPRFLFTLIPKESFGYVGTNICCLCCVRVCVSQDKEPDEPLYDQRNLYTSEASCNGFLSSKIAKALVGKQAIQPYLVLSPLQFSFFVPDVCSTIFVTTQHA